MASAALGNGSMNGNQMVMPADYMRIAQQHLAQSQTQSQDSNTVADEDFVPDVAQTLAAGNTQPYPEYAPRAETARLAYLMLATFGR